MQRGTHIYSFKGRRKRGSLSRQQICIKSSIQVGILLSRDEMDENGLGGLESFSAPLATVYGYEDKCLAGGRVRRAPPVSSRLQYFSSAVGWARKKSCGDLSAGGGWIIPSRSCCPPDGIPEGRSNVTGTPPKKSYQFLLCQTNNE